MARERFEHRGNDLRNELEHLRKEASRFARQLKEAPRGGDENNRIHDELESVFLEETVEAWQGLLDRHNKIMAAEGNRFLEMEAAFNRDFDQASRRRELARRKTEMTHLEMELDFHRKEGDEDLAVALEKRLKQWRDDIAVYREQMASWDKVRLARTDGRHEEAEAMEQRLWLDERTATFAREFKDSQQRIVDANARVEFLRKEIAIAEIEANSVKGMRKDHHLRIREWERLSNSFEKLDFEARQQWLDRFDKLNHEFELKREIMEMAIQLVDLRLRGRVGEANEIKQRLDELKRVLKEHQGR